MIWTPFGKRRLIYSDYTASGRALSFVEDYMRCAVLPLYANTHTEASATGLQTTVLREEARTIVARSVNAPPDEYVTLFVGTGSTQAQSISSAESSASAFLLTPHRSSASRRMTSQRAKGPSCSSVPLSTTRMNFGGVRALPRSLRLGRTAAVVLTWSSSRASSRITHTARSRLGPSQRART